VNTTPETQMVSKKLADVFSHMCNLDLKRRQKNHEFKKGTIVGRTQWEGKWGQEDDGGMNMIIIPYIHV
jgi:hypothetical protein